MRITPLIRASGSAARITLATICLVFSSTAGAADFDAAQIDWSSARDDIERTEPETVVEHNPRPLGRDVHVHGMVEMEALLAGNGLDSQDVDILYTQFDRGVQAPKEARNAGRQLGWRRQFRPKVTVTREPLTTGKPAIRSTATAAPTPWYVDEAKNKGNQNRLCVEVDQPDNGPVELATWTDLDGRQRGPGDQTARDQTTMMLMVNSAKPTAVVNLAPGESMTIIEVQGASLKRQPRRKMTLDKGDQKMIVLQRAATQQVCMEY